MTTGNQIEPEKPPSAFLSVKEAMTYLGLTDYQLRKLIWKKKINYYRVGERLVKFKKEDLDAWIESQKVEAQPQT